MTATAPEYTLAGLSVTPRVQAFELALDRAKTIIDRAQLDMPSDAPISDGEFRWMEYAMSAVEKEINYARWCLRNRCEKCPAAEGGQNVPK